MVILGIGLGLVAGYLLEATTNMDELPPYFIMVVVFGGLVIILFYALFGR